MLGKLRQSLFIAAQYLLPQRPCSRLAGHLADACSRHLKNLLIRSFIAFYKVNMSEALAGEAEDYESFNAFFTRPLKPEARPIAAPADAAACPADGAVCALGPIDGARLMQAKGRHFSVVDLLGGSQERAQPFLDGSFFTVYLAPRDYHRVHLPCGGALREMVYIPGRLFSVNAAASAQIPGLFARNERVVCLFDTETGPMAVILVGAMIVAGIETAWSGRVAPGGKKVAITDYRQQAPAIYLQKGMEMGRFRLGSTVIVLFGPGMIDWAADLEENSRVLMGQRIGRLCAGQHNSPDSPRA